ncbi:Acyl-CoA synthetase (AMP-forming)/AMP-acid ligase II [Cupriavidus taiwanensis]|uniref:Acyl-CoA synthetase (AMP-forming)/AMP-acid ligase II n=1 Tax=Cupriavidus taiwanensis TaxID=164546 RepID=A0A976G438_9BURK|nr:AMP-binding protein [Cupriavidus taiwanensis]SOZ64512.1 Acyl-CoA synthetase (AMP-forming)/AMP-acid ligase II [Cupriavidus taiwanensis]SOZ65245.1 Acyl-CoA synthetase (AMP-forming)/AMP-acid ligase II [Cupriavidus taiwanensis]SOZ68860.1 Acyl-CoA synthetase (AMP-forming)/AMP-acid ligase II [Cupriavidus taiwanensis]SPA08299.1 Acyl-CoA synthetase (AMP-forming)/AMP-acid ligase II [Cupriavidus taiwanensis]SPA23092.1 Acyl-CoA synthetase (AMP-forming)/AMP-acid ligase II [Cupriavidus taiwanensis]
MKANFACLTAQIAMQHRDREALVNIERNRRFTHEQLHRFTNRVANMLRERLGLRRGDTYLCILENDNLSLLHAWTALKGEAAACWTNFRDSIDEHRWQIDFIRPKVVFIENTLIDGYFAMLQERGITVVCMDPPASPRPGLLCFEDLIEGVPDTDPGVESDVIQDVLVYRFTGGTTGKSKCAQYTMDNWLANRDSFYAGAENWIDAGTRYIHMAPISHGSGLGLLPALFRGGCTVTQNAPDLRQWCRNVQEHRITTAMMVPTLLYRLLDLPEATSYDLSSLTTCFYGAAPMSPNKLRALQQRFGNIFVQAYGSTECMQRVAVLTKADHATVSDERLGSAGRVTGQAEVVIVDEAGQPVAPGVTGEIWLRSRAVISGYYNNPEGTAAEFENGFWKSGDLGYLDEEGFLFIVDRKKDMIITGGFNVYAIEVEGALSAHPAVAISAVVGVPDEQWGEIVHAEVVLKPGCEVSAEALIEHVKGRIGRFKAPKSIVFVDEIPVSVVGKVQRRQVREKYWKNHTRRVA